MSKPDDIPQDIWDAAEIATIGWVRTEDDGSPEATFDNFVNAIARAILDERDRCWKIAYCAYDRKTEICSRIVRKIRSGVER